MKKIITLFPLESVHVNLADDQYYERLLPIEEPTDPEEGLFLFAKKEEMSYSIPDAELISKIPTPLGVIRPSRVMFQKKVGD